MANQWPHYAWAAGHFILLLASLRYILAWVTFKAAAYTFWYKLAFLGAIVSYAIVVYKSLGTPQPNMTYVRKALADENFQYFVLAIFWWFNKPVSLALLPYATFSLFHALTFTRTNIIPKIFPPTPAPGQSERAAQHPFAKSIHGWVKTNYDPAMRFVAWIELVLAAQVTLGAVLGFVPWISGKMPFRNSLLMPLLFAHFIRLRWYHSGFTRHVLQTSDAAIQRYVDSPNAHPVAKKAWGPVRQLITRWGGSPVIEPRAANAPAGAGARG